MKTPVLDARGIKKQELLSAGIDGYLSELVVSARKRQKDVAERSHMLCLSDKFPFAVTNQKDVEVPFVCEWRFDQGSNKCPVVDLELSNRAMNHKRLGADADEREGFSFANLLIGHRLNYASMDELAELGPSESNRIDILIFGNSRGGTCEGWTH